MPGIGVLSSLPYTRFAPYFDQGFNSPLIAYRNLQVNLGYSIGKLNNGLTQLLADNNVTLIVSCGGMVTELVAANSTINYISLVGSQPTSLGRNYRGHVDLGSLSSNIIRRHHLRNVHGIGFLNQCLFSNDLSAMSGQERGPTAAGAGLTAAGAWGYIAQVQISDADTTAQIQQKYTDAFAALPANIGAVIISADPYFNYTKNYLVQAANSWVNTPSTARRVCYPLQEYQTTVPTPASGKTCICGPTLRQAYNYLGQLAGSVINTSAAPGPLPQPPCSDH